MIVWRRFTISKEAIVAARSGQWAACKIKQQGSNGLAAVGFGLNLPSKKKKGKQGGGK